ncbi:hypothetical protein M407DRAFT_242944 [Tulasnella calospora MUT 4182]|uniref:Uncharacterized protein n=1 Tax=Tulasnella calospora MUT 4182 TaxID=1051891 RepID=A0A0C3L478_9AGAM|nr:hypothetical protein M407DRAFT_242944 [Tulasnella calospora MUT 4182]
MRYFVELEVKKTRFIYVDYRTSPSISLLDPINRMNRHGWFRRTRFRPGQSMCRTSPITTSPAPATACVLSTDPDGLNV